MERDMQRNADYLRRGLGEYAVMSESNFTQGLNQVRDQLKQVQQALGAGANDPKNGQQGQGQQGGGGGGYNGGAYNGGANYGGPGVVNPQARLGDLQVPDYQTQYRNTMQSLQQLQQQYRNDPATAHDIGQLIQQLRQLDPYTYANDPMLSQRIQAAVLPTAEQVEMELRRKVDETGGSVRSPGTEKVPPGYSGATAEYFKKLSKDK